MLRRRKKLFGGARFNPLVYSPALWLDASDASTLFQDRTGASASTPVTANADPVGTWKDKSGNARHVTAASDAARPTYTTGAQNGLPALTFDGVNDYLANTDIVSIASGTGKSLTAFVVVKTGTINRVAWGFGRSTSANPMLVCYPYLTGSKADLTHRTDGNAETNIDTAASSTATNTTYIIAVKLNPTTAYISVNGGTFASKAITQSSVTLDRFSIGTFDRFGGASGFLDGVIAELAMFSSELDSVQITNMLRYLGNRWGITVA